MLLRAAKIYSHDGLNKVLFACFLESGTHFVISPSLSLIFPCLIHIIFLQSVLFLGDKGRMFFVKSS